MTEQNPFGLNILDRNVNWSRAYDYLAQAQPAMTLVYNNVNEARGMKALWPDMHVVHRQYNANDHQWHMVTSPLAWFTAHQAHGAGGVIVQCYNEPLASDDGVIFAMLDVWQHARGTQTHVVGPNYSVGNPNEKRIEAGDYDALIREVALNPYAWLGLHEYTKGNPEAEYPYYIGRHSYWYARAEKLGLKLTRVLITEGGLDMGGGPEDGWRNRGISGQQYADMLIRARALSPYRPPVAIFGFGDGFGWESFNCDDDGFLNTLKTYREPVEDTVDYEWTEGMVSSVPDTFVNVRSAPSTTADIRGKLYVGNPATYDDGIREVDAKGQYEWTPVKWNGQVCWVATFNLSTGKPAAVFTEVDTVVDWQLPFNQVDWVTTAVFGEPRPTGPHEGYDFAPKKLSIETVGVYAMTDGIVDSVRDFEGAQAAGKLTTGYGCYVRVKSGDFTHWYCHLSMPLVKVGDTVKMGQPVGIVGSTGNSSGHHLHITIQQAGKGTTMAGLPNVIDPATVISELA